MAPGSWCVVVGHVYSRQSVQTRKRSAVFHPRVLSLARASRSLGKMDEHLNTQLSVLEQSPRSQPIELVIVLKSDDEAKLAELEEQVASLQRKAADSSRCKVAKQLRTQLAEARAEVEAHEAQRVESCASQQQQLETLNISLLVASKQLTRATAKQQGLELQLAKLTRRSSLRRSSLVTASRRLEQQQQQLDQAHAAMWKTRPIWPWPQRGPTG